MSLLPHPLLSSSMLSPRDLSSLLLRTSPMNSGDFGASHTRLYAQERSLSLSLFCLSVAWLTSLSRPLSLWQIVNLLASNAVALQSSFNLASEPPAYRVRRPRSSLLPSLPP
jgi:hypothetical protein